MMLLFIISILIIDTISLLSLATGTEKERGINKGTESEKGVLGFGPGLGGDDLECLAGEINS
eukprot:11133712-Ditylum_brightwellii.AAC.1